MCVYILTRVSVFLQLFTCNYEKKKKKKKGVSKEKTAKKSAKFPSIHIYTYALLEEEKKNTN